MRLFLRPWIGLYATRSQGWRCGACPGMGGQIFCSCNICTSTILGGRIAQGGKDAGAHMPRMEQHATRSQKWWCGARPVISSLEIYRQITQKFKTMLRIWLCLAASLLTITPAISAPACPSVNYDETSKIKTIVDGDTLHLNNGKKVRLIGINTPESAHANKAAEPFAAEATNALSTLFTNNDSISLVYGQEKDDRYKRLLAHGFTANGENIQAVLLAQGYARVITFPPNTIFTACYQQLEREARCNKVGLWKKTKPLVAKKLNDTHIGFQLVKGRLKNITINKKGIWLILDDKLTVGIRPDNQSLFDIKTIYSMLNQKIVVRGWLNRDKKNKSKNPLYYIRIRHPSSIETASSFSCK